MHMPTKHSVEEEPKDDGSTSEKLVVEFTNGSLQQLRDLAAHFNIKDQDPYEAMMFAISVLEKIKENNEKKNAGNAEF